MKTFSIAELEQFSLIKAHTYRTWEKRFEIFKTQRKASKVRYYTIEELAFLLDFALLNRLGYKVSFLASLDKSAVSEKIHGLANSTARQEHEINQLIIYMFSLDIEAFELTLDSAVFHWGIDTTVEEVIIPFLERLQLFSYKGHTGSEYHLVVTALRKKFILALERVNPLQELSRSAVLFLPEGEHYDLLLLYMSYKLRKAGLNVLYLGTNISANNLELIISRKQPHFLVTYDSPARNRLKKNVHDHLVEKNSDMLYIVGTHVFSLEKNLSDAVKYVNYRQVDSEVLCLQ